MFGLYACPCTCIRDGEKVSTQLVQTVPLLVDKVFISSDINTVSTISWSCPERLQTHHRHGAHRTGRPHWTSSSSKRSSKSLKKSA